MADKTGTFDIAIVGAGFFGVRLALYLSRHDLRIALIERESRICRRASYVNQARIHNGYHYPRSLSTALGSHKHYERFCREMAGCIDSEFEHVYAIARDGSYTNAYQFQEFCRALGLPLRATPPRMKSLFDPDMVEDSFVVREAVFDASAIGEKLDRELDKADNVELFAETQCQQVEVSTTPAKLRTTRGTIEAQCVLIVAYSEINHLLAMSGLELMDLKAELTEICLVNLPQRLRGFGVTIMDGPYFSSIPMPAERCHSLWHVRYSPHVSWNLRTHAQSSYDILERYEKKSRYPFMIKDAQRYMPSLADAHYLRSLYEVKALPNKHEVDDGRPILFHKHSSAPLCVSVLGSKLDSIFELEAAVEELIGLSASDRKQD